MTRQAPGEPQQSQDLPADVGRENQEPGNRIAISDFRRQYSEETAVAKAAVAAENGLPDEIDSNGHDNEANEQKTGQYGQLFGGEPSEIT